MSSTQGRPLSPSTAVRKPCEVLPPSPCQTAYLLATMRESMGNAGTTPMIPRRSLGQLRGCSASDTVVRRDSGTFYSRSYEMRSGNGYRMESYTEIRLAKGHPSSAGRLMVVNSLDRVLIGLESVCH